VIAQRIYLTRLDAFDTALQGFSLAATLADIGRATKDGEGQRDPYAAITSGFPRTKGGACNLTSN
jgi:hypothetical protein